GARVESGEGAICFKPTPEHAASLHLPADASINWISAEQSNSSLIVGDTAVIKMFRRLADGEHPEGEMARYLTPQHFSHTPALLGEVVRVAPDGTNCLLAVAQGFVRNQGDAWSWTLDRLTRALEDLSAHGATIEGQAPQLADCIALATAIGARLGDMHRILAQPNGDAAFAPERATQADVVRWEERAHSLLEGAFDALAARQDWQR